MPVSSDGLGTDIIPMADRGGGGGVNRVSCIFNEFYKLIAVAVLINIYHF